MANSDKDILITPNTGQTSDPTIEFTGADNTPLTLRVLDDGTVSFEGTAGQLFSISDGLTGTIFSVNDISGIPSIEVLDDGTVKVAEYSGNVGIGKASPSTKLDVDGTVTATSFAGSGSAITNIDWANVDNKPDPTITLGGDLTGSITLTDLVGGTLTAAVVDDSHNHIISNVDGLQTALDEKQPIDDDLTAIAGLTGTSGLLKKTATNTWTLDTTNYGIGNQYYQDTAPSSPSVGDIWVESDVDVDLGVGNTYTQSEIDSFLALKSNINSPTFTGIPAAPTAASGTNTTQIATTAFVQAATAALVDSAPTTLDTLNELAAALGDDPNFATTVSTALGNKQPLDADLTAIAALTGTSGFLKKTAADTWTLDTTTYQPSSTALTTSTSFGGDVSGTYNAIVIADDSHNHIISNVDGLQTALDAKAPLASPALTGTPTAPTAAAATNNTQIATTAYVKSQGYSTTTGTVTSVAMTVPTGLSVSGSPITSSGTLAISLSSGYTIPTTASLDAKAPLASPTFTGTVTAPTLSLTTADTATTSSHYFVETSSDGIIRPKTLANVRSEIVTNAAVNSAAATTVGTVTSGTWAATDIALAHGGTNASLTAVNGGIVYSTSSAMAITSAGTAGQILTSNGAGAPTWQNAPDAGGYARSFLLGGM